MKSKLKPKKTKDEIQYPCLMVSDDLVVLFSSCRKGMTISQSLEYPNYKIGHYSATWDMPRFKVYSGSVELSND